MNIRQGFEERSRLGRLLINRGYLSPVQLEEGLRLQGETGQRLGEVLVQAGWITERELFRVLKHQSRYRNAAALIAVVTLPLQPLVSFAASNGADSPQETSPDSGEMYRSKGLSPLSDDDLARVAGQGDRTLAQRIAAVNAMLPGSGDESQDPDVVEGIKLTAHIFVPVLSFLDSDLTIKGVHYRDDESRQQLGDDGSITLAFPERIEEIRMENIRVSGGRTPALGNVSIHDIRFDPASRMTIYTR